MSFLFCETSVWKEAHRLAFLSAAKRAITDTSWMRPMTAVRVACVECFPPSSSLLHCRAVIQIIPDLESEEEEDLTKQGQEHCQRVYFVCLLLAQVQREILCRIHGCMCAGSVANAPRNVNRRVQTLRELDDDIKYTVPSATVRTPQHLFAC